jgi:peptidoglycan/xylan/chitin deacetylase (PgdA/CDA1 family)
MKSIFKRFCIWGIKCAAFAVPFSWVRVLCGQDYFGPFYHIIGTNENPLLKNLYKYKTVKQFRADLEFFCQHFEPVSVNSYINRLNGKESYNKPFFFLSFDDGMSECYEFIAPILKEFKISACFFVCSDFIDNKSMFFRHKISLIIERLKSKEAIPDRLYELMNVEQNDLNKVIQKLSACVNPQTLPLDNVCEVLDIDIQKYLSVHKPYLTSEQLKELVKAGHTVGGHSKSHPIYASLSPEQRLNETNECLTEISILMEQDITHLSFPFDSHDVPNSFFSNFESIHFFDSVSFVKEKHNNLIGRNFMERFDCKIPVREFTAREILLRRYREYFSSIPTLGR